MIDSAHSSPSPLSSANSSQDSLHKHQKKRGIKSSIGRLFSKKEKQKTKEAMIRGENMATGNNYIKFIEFS